MVRVGIDRAIAADHIARELLAEDDAIFIRMPSRSRRRLHLGIRYGAGRDDRQVSAGLSEQFLPHAGCWSRQHE